VVAFGGELAAAETQDYTWSRATSRTRGGTLTPESRWSRLRLKSKRFAKAPSHCHEKAFQAKTQTLSSQGDPASFGRTYPRPPTTRGRGHKHVQSVWLLMAI
jgi:hypothetical protein